MGITTVAGVAVQAQHRASCHCGTVELLLDLPEGIVDPRRCDCSMCRRRGAIAASVAEDGLHIVRGQAHLRLYQFNTHVAESTRTWPSTTSATSVASTRTTAAAPTRTSTATT